MLLTVFAQNVGSSGIIFYFHDGSIETIVEHTFKLLYERLSWIMDREALAKQGDNALGRVCPSMGLRICPSFHV